MDFQTRRVHFRCLNFLGNYALALRNHPPVNLDAHAYAVMNAVTTAWQMKDWVYAPLAGTGQL